MLLVADDDCRCRCREYCCCCCCCFCWIIRVVVWWFHWKRVAKAAIIHLLALDFILLPSSLPVDEDFALRHDVANIRMNEAFILSGIGDDSGLETSGYVRLVEICFAQSVCPLLRESASLLLRKRDNAQIYQTPRRRGQGLIPSPSPYYKRRSTENQTFAFIIILIMSKHHPDLVMCRKQPGVAIGRLCEKCTLSSSSWQGLSACCHLSRLTHSFSKRQVMDFVVSAIPLSIQKRLYTFVTNAITAAIKAAVSFAAMQASRMPIIAVNACNSKMIAMVVPKLSI